MVISQPYTHPQPWVSLATIYSMPSDSPPNQHLQVVLPLSSAICPALWTCFSLWNCSCCQISEGYFPILQLNFGQTENFLVFSYRDRCQEYPHLKNRPHPSLCLLNEVHFQQFTMCAELEIGSLYSNELTVPISSFDEESVPIQLCQRQHLQRLQPLPRSYSWL